ncbi:ABC-type transport auxiliary lipoprotein family protein [Cobetia sp. ICG0124]|uniref:PqiC family protein n=1 Tax=Cobetia sp. ICG0124 TaxID=2053669 RepID=UPI0013E40E29|nr:ABC-type transport auxiliary lipoprotein family protein [Cobetia sp. ICG0124]
MSLSIRTAAMPQACSASASPRTSTSHKGRFGGLMAGLLMLGTLAGCTTAATGVAYLLPQTTQTAAQRSVAADAPLLEVMPVQLASYLEGGSLVYQTDDITLVQASQNLWADDLQDMLTRQLLNQLKASPAQPLSQYRIADTSLSGLKGARLSVSLDRFIGRHDGQSVITGRWRLRGVDGSVLEEGDIQTLTPLTDDGYPALVNSLGEGWRVTGEQLAREIAKALPATAGAS